MRRATCFVLASIGLAFTFAFSSVASAGTIEAGLYQLLDHGHGGELGPDYGLRMDSMDWLFSVELGVAEVLLDWDGGDTATLNGTLFPHFDPPDLWQVHYEVSDIATVGTEGFTATAGSGTLTSPSGDVFDMIGKQNDDGIAFRLLADGNRLPDDRDTPVATGWLEGAGTNDWLVRTVLVPEPSTALLVGLGLLAITSTTVRTLAARTS